MFLGYIGHSEKSTLNEKLKKAFLDKYSDFKLTTIRFENHAFELHVCSKSNLIQRQFHFFENNSLLLVLIGCLFNATEFSIDDFSAAFSTEGPNAINSLHGEYAGILIDKSTNSSFIFKDHLGTTPITLYNDEKGVIFCSNGRVLSKFIHDDQEISDKYRESLFYSFAPNYGIERNERFLKVRSGSFVQSSSFKNTKYWNLTDIKVKQNANRKEVIATLTDLLDKSISNRIKCAGKHIGVHLSGGLDSALVAGKVNTLNSNPRLSGFSWSPPIGEFSGEALEYDERQPINELATRLQIETSFTSYTSKELVEDILDWEHPLDFPFERSLLKNAENAQTETIFTGFGGDEFIGVQNVAFLNYLFRCFKWRSFLKFNPKKGLLNTMKFFVNEGIFPKRRRPMLKSKFSSKLLNYLLPPISNNFTGSYSNMWYSPQKYMMSIIDSRHIESRCEQWFNLGAQYGIRYSHPLLDKSIVEYCYSLPIHIFFEKLESKSLIRELAYEYSTASMRAIDRTLDPALFTNSNDVDLSALSDLISTFNKIDNHSYFNFIDIKKLKEDVDKHEVLSVRQKTDLIYVLKYYLTAYHLINELKY